MIASVLLLYLLFIYLFRRPVRDIVQTMAHARKGDLSARAFVHRNDEQPQAHAEILSINRNLYRMAARF